jgi:hypothetical protein
LNNFSVSSSTGRYHGKRPNAHHAHHCRHYPEMTLATTEVRPIEKGDTVRMQNLNRYTTAFAAKVANRDAVVVWVGPDIHGQFKGKACVRFLKRNGRGKEFTETLSIRDLELAGGPAAQVAVASHPSESLTP